MNALFVDSDRKALREFPDAADWRKAGLSRMFTAEDNGQAIELLQTKDIRLLFRRIEGEEREGLELVRWVRANREEVECILLLEPGTAQSIREVLELSNLRYLPWPATPVELEQAAGQAVQRLIRADLQKRAMDYFVWVNRDTRVSACVRRFLGESGARTGQLLTELFEQGIALDRWGLVRPVLLHLIDTETGLDWWSRERLSKNLGVLQEECREEWAGEAVPAQMDAQHYLLLIPERREQVQQRKALEKLTSHLRKLQKEITYPMAFYVGGPVELTELAEAYRELQRMSIDNVAGECRVFYRNGPGVRRETNYPEMEYWQQLLEHGGTEQVRRLAHQFLEENGGAGGLGHEMLARFHQDFVNMALGAVAGEEQVREEILGRHFETYMRAYTNLADMHRFVDTAMDAVHRYGKVAGQELGPVEKAVDYINRNLDRNVGGREIAKQVYLNPEYLSRLFKKEMGISMKDYTIRKKMDIACSMLAETRMPVYLVASRVGYTNFSYFSKVFKRWVGVSPQEYRGKVRAEAKASGE